VGVAGKGWGFGAGCSASDGPGAGRRDKKAKKSVQASKHPTNIQIRVS
jgi:hypothetical protein